MPPPTVQNPTQQGVSHVRPPQSVIQTLNNPVITTQPMPSTSHDEPQPSTSRDSRGDFIPPSLLQTPQVQVSSNVSRNEFEQLKNSMSSMRSMLSDFMASFSNKQNTSQPSQVSDQLINQEPHAFQRPVSVPVNNPVILQQPVPTNQFDNNLNLPQPSSSTTDDAATRIINQALAAHLQSVSANQASGKDSTDKSRQLDRKIPQSLMNDIWEDKYVDLENLIDKKDDPTAPLVLKSIQTDNLGEIVQLVKHKQPKGITNIDQWSFAFDIYMSMYTRKFFHQTHNLLTYSNKIKELASQGGDFLRYDEEFRKSRARYGSPWELPDLELWVDCKQAGLTTQVINIINSLNKNPSINLPFQVPPLHFQTQPQPIPLTHLSPDTQMGPATPFTIKGGVAGPHANFHTCATTLGVDKSTPCTFAPKALVVDSRTPPPPPPSPGGDPTHPPLPTPIHPDRLYDYLQGYDPDLRQYLFQGFTHGFSIHNHTSIPQDPPKNLKSSYMLPSVVDDKLQKELAKGRIAGPFLSQPLPNMVFSPLGLQPKKVEGQFRVIHHLSFPKGQSVNDGISFQDSTVQYASVTQAMKHIVHFGRGCFMAKTDIQSAFRIVPVNPTDYPLLGFKWKGSFYYDKCLPMGCASSCAIFEKLSTALEWIISQESQDVAILHILDDFLFISNTYQTVHNTLINFQKICQEVGVPLAPDKTVGPTTVLDFAGIRLDSVDLSASLPPDKILKFSQALNDMITSRSVQLKQIQSLAGMLNFCCGVIAPARAFSRRLYNLQIGLSRPYHHRKVTNEVRADLEVWQTFLSHYNRRTLLLDYKFLSQDLLHLFTDASTTIGYGGYFGDRWFHGLWSPKSRTRNIAVLELYPICIAIKLWGDLLANKCLQINSDNMALVHVLNTSTSKDPSLMILLRIFVLECMSKNIMIRSKHLLGVANVCSDLLSRGQVAKAKRLYPQLQAQPVSIPVEWDLDLLLTV